MSPTAQVVEHPARITTTRGPSTLLIGPPGSGKTTSLVTYIEAGLELFVVVTDPNGEEALIDAMIQRKLPMEMLHWSYIPPASPSWDTLMQAANTISDLSYEAISKIKAGVRKEDCRQWLDLLSVLSNFKCERTGESYGPVDNFGPDRALAIDTLSGLSRMSFDLMVGMKPIAHQGEYGIAMMNIERLVLKFCADLKCFRCLNGHIEREPDIITGAPKTMVSALGRKLAPKLPKDFSDVVMCVREGSSYFWSTKEANVDLKHRTLPLESKLKPTFVQVVDAWKRRGASLNPELYKTQTKET